MLTPYELKKIYEGKSPIILSLGSSAEYGKTTITSKLIENLKESGLKVVSSKVNGSGNIRDK
ncbi:MAG: hypothetical protein ACOC1K_03855 [Nanoarchaeota archaeon]